MKLEIGDILILKDGSEVSIIKIRDKTYAFELWVEDTKTWLPYGCRYSDIKWVKMSDKQTTGEKEK